MKRILQLARSRWFALIAAVIGVGIPAAWLWTLVGPSEQAVKVRSALILRLGVPADFDWTPDRVPASYERNSGGVPQAFRNIARGIEADTPSAADDEFQRALAISRHLMSAPSRVDGPIRSDTLSSYRAIVGRGQGYCADFTQVFNGIAEAEQLPVREWTIAFEGFGSGHAFNEVFDRARGKWVLVDSFHSLYFVDPASREPLSVREVHDRLLGLVPRTDIAIEHIRADRFPFRTEAIALDYYRRGMPQLALMWGNNVFDYDRSRIVRLVGRVSRSLGQLSAIVLGVYPEGRIYPTGVSQRDLESLRRTRSSLLMALCSLVLATVFFGLQLIASLLHSRPDPTRVRRQG